MESVRKNNLDRIRWIKEIWFMNYVVKHGVRSGIVDIPSSKSYAHRQLICAALANKNSKLLCTGISKDIQATIDCLNALGAKIEIENGNELNIVPIGNVEKIWSGSIVLPCNESGSTLRFLLPVACAIGGNYIFDLAEGLAARPIDALIEALKSHGVTIKKEDNRIYVEGKLANGTFSIPGNVSSQYISGLLMALPILEGDSKLNILGNIESQDYIRITEECIKKAGIDYIKLGNEYVISGKQQYVARECDIVEKDWSNAAFFMCMGALSREGIIIDNMNPASSQGDKEIMNILEKFGAVVEMEIVYSDKNRDVISTTNDECKIEVIENEKVKDIAVSEENYKKNDGYFARIMVRKGTLKGQTIDASEIPDLVPTIAALASLCEGTTNIINASRLRFKESDRLKTIADMLKRVGALVTELEDSLVINGKPLDGGVVDAYNDHRIAMAAAVAACGCKSDVTVEGAECVTKSFPAFWECFEGLAFEGI